MEKDYKYCEIGSSAGSYTVIIETVSQNNCY